jgi:hypothetical protein
MSYGFQLEMSTHPFRSPNRKELKLNCVHPCYLSGVSGRVGFGPMQDPSIGRVLLGIVEGHAKRKVGCRGVSNKILAIKCVRGIDTCSTSGAKSKYTRHERRKCCVRLIGYEH